MRCVVDFFGPSHVLFGTDSPLGPATAVEATIADLESSGRGPDELEAIFAGNATRLLSLS
jgi:predicted TIM-barrel fold metal-dependent hydrolase